MALQEVAAEDVEACRSGGQARSGGEPATSSAPADASQGPPAEAAALAAADTAIAPAQAAVAAGDAANTLAALEWATGLKDEALLAGLAASLPTAVREEQVRLYEASLSIAAEGPTKVQKLLVHPHLLKSRMQVAAAFHDYLADSGWTFRARVPRNATSSFVTTLVWRQPALMRTKCKLVRRWHQTWQLHARLQNPQLRVCGKRGPCAQTLQTAARRRNVSGQGRPHACPWVRQELYEWFVTMRYSIEWKACEKSLRSSGKKKCMGRFTRALLRQKVNQILHDYCHQCLLRGVKPTTFQPTATWFDTWEADYGLSMRKPNRKYKVPKDVMEERLEIGWCNVARVRALCLEVHGYDPELENWDQSPFHNNESGSQNMNTLAVAGSTVPLIEGHADTRERWTGNFTTFSNTARLLEEGPPYCEFVFKAIGEVLELRLREYIRSRGFGKWVSVATSPKGSYRTPDILNFLETHLPEMTPQSRRWRIIMADDFSAHLSPQVFRLCWSRGYVFIAHGGGVTPVVQTPDTDLNQHVKREYTAAETVEFMRQMREGVCVPRCRPEQCMDIMVDVMSNMQLHLRAADGYVKTGMTVSLDGKQDQFIVREAGDFWKELGMREKINSAVAEVREEARAGRLRWSFADVQRLIKPYPKRPAVDAVLARLGDDTWIEEGDSKYEDEDGEASAHEEGGGESAEESDGHETPDEAVLGCFSAVADEVGQEAEQGRSCGPGEAAGGHPGEGSSGSAALAIDEADAETLAHSSHLVATLESAMASLKACGAMNSVVNLENEIRKERRRMRAMSNEDPEVLLALARQRDEEEARDRERRHLVDQANARTLSAARLRKQIKDANEVLRKRKHDIMEAECLLETKHAVKTYSLEDLGQGRIRCGGAAGKKRRLEILDRLARIGQGLSPAQKNDFSWWKDAWDAKMLQEHGDDWPGVFAGWTQRVLADCEDGWGNAFSMFVHSETRRCFDGTVALRVP